MLLLGLVERPGSYHGGELPRHFFCRKEFRFMTELSVFIDESGDFGSYKHHSPFYIVALVFHDQENDISKNISHLEAKLRSYGLPNHTIHTAKLIRREDEYNNMKLHERKRIFNALYNFTRTSKISFHTIMVEKKQCVKAFDLVVRLTKQLSSFLNEHINTLTEYDRIVIYYDNGQRELTNIILSVFNTVLNHVEYKPDVSPVKYKLFQATDMLCTLELSSLKADKNMFSKSDVSFFTSARDLNKSYMKAIQKKRFI